MILKKELINTPATKYPKVVILQLDRGIQTGTDAPHQVRCRLIRCGMTELAFLTTGLIILKGYCIGKTSVS